MPGPSFINNPASAYDAVTDYRLYRTTAGYDIELGKGEVYVLRANATILRGQALEHVAPTLTVPHSVTPMAAASGIHLFAGVALEAAAAGDEVPVMRRGFCVVFTDDSDTPAFGQVLLKPDATTGQFATAAAAATIQNVLGVVLGAEQGGVALRMAPAFVDPAMGTVNPAS